MIWNEDSTEQKIENQRNFRISRADLPFVLSAILILSFLVIILRSKALSMASQRQVQMVMAEAEVLRKQVKNYEMMRAGEMEENLSQISRQQKELADLNQAMTLQEEQIAIKEQQIHQIEDELQNKLHRTQLDEKNRESVRILVERIKKNLEHSGVSAEVHSQSGEVTVRFAQDYFDKNRADLKPRMIQILKKLIPIYAKSLFQDPKVAKKIAAIEITGFSTPTYLGKPIDPQSLSSLDRHAANYTMDLSYRRAKSIFEYIFDTQRIRFDHQKDLLSRARISVRSDCDQMDCRNVQKITLKFTLADELPG